MRSIESGEGIAGGYLLRDPDTEHPSPVSPSLDHPSPLRGAGRRVRLVDYAVAAGNSHCHT